MEIRPDLAGPRLEFQSDMKIEQPENQSKSFPSLSDIRGRVLPPLILYMLGVPGGICLLLWVFFFRGK